FFFSSRRRHTSFSRDWSSDVCSSDLKAVAIATPKMTLAIVPFFALAITNANPPKNAMSTSRISGAVRAKSSEDSSLKGKNLKNRSEERRVGKEKKYRRTYKHIIKNIR